jgi:hypothetical protein
MNPDGVLGRETLLGWPRVGMEGGELGVGGEGHQQVS